MDGEALDAVIRGAQRGDPACLDALVDRYASRIYGFLFRMTASRQDAEDLMQEVFVRLVRMIGGYRHEDRFEAWIFRIAANLARDRVRRAKRGPRFVSQEAAAGNGHAVQGGNAANDFAASVGAVDARLVLDEDVDALRRALGQLPDAEREVVMLRHFSEMSFKQIAEATGVPLGTALARGHRGLQHLRELMSLAETSRKPAGRPVDETGIAGEKVR